MSFKQKAAQARSVLALIELDGDHIERIMDLVQTNPDVFQPRLGGSLLEAAANYLFALVAVKRAAQPPTALTEAGKGENHALTDVQDCPVCNPEAGEQEKKEKRIADLERKLAAARKNLIPLLCDIAQIFDGWHAYDEGVSAGKRVAQERTNELEAALTECEAERDAAQNRFVAASELSVARGVEISELRERIVECERDLKWSGSLCETARAEIADLERKLAEHPRIVANRYCCCCGKVVATEAGEQPAGFAQLTEVLCSDNLDSDAIEQDLEQMKKLAEADDHNALD